MHNLKIALDFSKDHPLGQKIQSDEADHDGQRGGVVGKITQKILVSKNKFLRARWIFYFASI